MAKNNNNVIDICPFCEVPADIKLVKDKNHYVVHGKKIDITIEQFYCPKCKQYFQNGEQLEKTLEKIKLFKSGLLS